MITQFTAKTALFEQSKMVEKPKISDRTIINPKYATPEQLEEAKNKDNARLAYDVHKVSSQKHFDDSLLAYQRTQELAAKDHVNSLDMVDDQIIKRRLETLNLKAQVDTANAKSEQEQARAGLMIKARDNFDKLPQALQVYVMRAVYNPQDMQEHDILLDDQLREFLKSEKESMAEKAKADARSTAAEAGKKELDLEKARDAYDKTRNHR